MPTKKMLNTRRIANWTRTVNMRLAILIGLTMNWNNVFALPNDLPCHFLDSVNITDGTLQPNRSIIYNGIEFPESQYLKINHDLDTKSDRHEVAPYYRGCLCNRMPCMRLCCPHGTIFKIEDHRKQCLPHEEAKNLEGKILDQNDQTIHTKFNRHFAFVADSPCSRAYIADDDFTITHRGYILHENYTLTHHDYCIKASLNAKTNHIDLDLAVCQHIEARNETSSKTRYEILPICMLLSVVFILATLLVYGFIPKLRNLSGKCLICYLAALAFAYTSLSLIQLNGSSHIHPVLCSSVGYLVFFSLFSAFLWLNVMNFDLWLCFQSSSSFRQRNERVQFYCYMLYGFGLPCLFTFIVYGLDRIDSIPQHYRPGIGHGTCFIQHDWIAQFLFLNLPLGIISILNIVLFSLTATTFRRVYRETAQMSSQESSLLRKTLQRKRDTFILYLRLSVVMGISWILEVISFLVAADSLIFMAGDMWNTLQGVFIFILFIMRRRVLRLIKERWNVLCNKPQTVNGSIATDSSQSDHYMRLNSMTTK